MSEPITLITGRVCRVCLIPNGEFSDIFLYSAAVMECAPVNVNNFILKARLIKRRLS